MDITILVARLLLGLIFLWAGVRKILHWSDTEDYMRTKRMRFIALLLPVAVGLQIVGSLSVMLGIYGRIGALLLILFTLPATTQMHDFWNLRGRERISEQSHFFKDLAIVGGLLLLILVGSGRYSIIGAT